MPQNHGDPNGGAFQKLVDPKMRNYDIGAGLPTLPVQDPRAVAFAAPNPPTYETIITPAVVKLVSAARPDVTA